MSTPIVSQALTALVGALGSLPELAGFTIIDRAGGTSAQPALRVGLVAQVDWSTNSSTGKRLTINITLTTKTGSFADLSDASAAIASLIAGTPLQVTGASTVLQRVATSSLDHDAKSNVERAAMQIELLLDCDPAS